MRQQSERTEGFSSGRQGPGNSMPIVFSPEELNFEQPRTPYTDHSTDQKRTERDNREKDSDDDEHR